MGESLVEVPIVEKKMDESVKSGGKLEVSVSFGRFEKDALAWEKWSSFSPNKYLDEVGSLSTPGSVAQKKAYFEAHYKKIAAAKKIEESEQEKHTNSVNSITDESYSENSSGIDASLGLSNDAKSTEENADTASSTVVTDLISYDVAKEDDARSNQGTERDSCENGLMDSAVSAEEVKEEATDELKCEVVGSKMDVKEESVLIDVEVVREVREDSSSAVEKASDWKNGKEHSRALEKEKPNMKNVTPKATPLKKDRNMSAPSKKSIISPVVKPSKSLTPTPRHSKPNPTPTTASQSSKKKPNQSPLPSRKTATPTSLHMSLNMGPTKSPAPTAPVPITRKSLIMEQMGDKDIVKRAFKSFQNYTNGNGNGLSPDEKSSTPKQVQTTPLKSKVATSPAPRNRNEGPRKDVQKVAAQRSQSATRTKPFPSSINGRPDKSSAPRSAVAVSPPIALKSAAPSIALKSDEKAEKRKEFLKKLEAKSIVREAENAQRGAKSKEEKESAMKKLRESLKFKAKPFPSSYRNQEKSHPEKESTKKEMHQ